MLEFKMLLFLLQNVQIFHNLQFLNSVHPFMPLLATSSGQRQFPWPGDSEGDSASDGEGGGDDVASSPGLRQDNTLSVWWAGPLSSVSEGTEDQSSVVVEAV